MTSQVHDDRVEDADLLAAHVAGSTTAFAQIVARHQNRLWAVALRMMRDPDDAADVVQDALVKAFRRADSFRGEAAVSTWLHRIVVTTAIDASRSASRAARPLADLDPPEEHDGVAASETRADLAAALAAIPADQRAAVVLVDMGGLPVAEAAWILQCPPGTVKSRCSRGRSRLADLLSGYHAQGGNREADDTVQGETERPPEEAQHSPRRERRS